MMGLGLGSIMGSWGMEEGLEGGDGGWKGVLNGLLGDGRGSGVCNGVLGDGRGSVMG